MPPKPAPSHEAVGEQQQRLVRRRAEAAGRVRGVDAVLQPARVLARLQADQLRLVAVREQPGAAAARWQRTGELDTLGARSADGDREREREAVGGEEAGEPVRQARQSPALACDVAARPGALAW